MSAPRTRGLAVAILVVAAIAIFIGVAADTVPAASAAAGASRYLHVSPTGTAAGDGSVAQPLSLSHALSRSGPVLPGDTLILHGGTYAGSFVSELRGTETAPITVRQAPGERATIDSRATAISVPALYITGAWTTYRGFEVMSSDPLRVISEGGSQPAALRRGMGVDVHAPHTRLIDLVVHDLADGIGLWSDAPDSEAYGNLIYYNGWSGADRAHGHGIYTQNQTGVRRIADNIVFSQFSHGIHAYGSGAASLDHIQLVGNVVFNNGALDRRYFDRNILLGGQRTAAAPVVEENYTYYTPGLRHGGENNIGYNAGCTSLIARGNYFAGHAGGGVPLRLSDRCTGLMNGNTFYGALEPKIAVLHPDNVYTTARPTGTRVFVRPHQYDVRRAHVVVFNWDRLPELTLDLSTLPFEPSKPIELRDAQNYFGEPFVVAPFGDGRITVPMRGATAAPPVGDIGAPPHTAPEFIVLIAAGTPRRHLLDDFAAFSARSARRLLEWLWVL